MIVFFLLVTVMAFALYSIFVSHENNELRAENRYLKGKVDSMLKEVDSISKNVPRNLLGGWMCDIND